MNLKYMKVSLKKKKKKKKTFLRYSHFLDAPVYIQMLDISLLTMYKIYI